MIRLSAHAPMRPQSQLASGDFACTAMLQNGFHDGAYSSRANHDSTRHLHRLLHQSCLCMKAEAVVCHLAALQQASAELTEVPGRCRRCPPPAPKGALQPNLLFGPQVCKVVFMHVVHTRICDCC